MADTDSRSNSKFGSISGFRHQLVATRLAWESLCTFAYVMHAHYDVLLCISAHRNKETDFMDMVY